MKDLDFGTDKEKEQILEALPKEMREKYREPHMSQEQLGCMKRRMEEAKMENRRDRVRSTGLRIAAAAAVVALAFVILPNTSASVAHAMQQIPVLGDLVKVVTIRDYQYEDNRNRADIHVAELQVEDLPTGEITDKAADETVREELKKSTEEINAEIQSITDELITNFEENMKSEEAYQDIIVKSELLATTEDYFTLKLFCYQGAGSGYQWNYYYTIDLNTGERLQLKELFEEGSDYITPISENIISQMRAQMAEDSNKVYWLDSDIEEWNFKQITDDTSFYVNEKGNVVICFNEGDVAPMYMGAMEFEIPGEAVADIRK